MSRKATDEIAAYFAAQPKGKLRVLSQPIHSEFRDVRNPAKRIEKVTQWATENGLKVESIGATEETSPHSYIFEKI
jgi:hypothetical protein